jgi:hypothetical protein
MIFNKNNENLYYCVYSLSINDLLLSKQKTGVISYDYSISLKLNETNLIIHDEELITKFNYITGEIKE